MAKYKVSDADLMVSVDAYYEHGGNKPLAAKSLKLTPSTFNRRLQAAQERLGVEVNKPADGRVEIEPSLTKDLPKIGCIKRYILTSAQNNTHLHPGFDNLVAYKDWLDGLRKASCELLVGTYSYNKAAYGKKAVKRGKHVAEDKDDVWYDPKIDQYINDESTALAPTLIWCGEQNILPTQINPLTNFANYNGTKSNIVPHAKVSLESIPTMSGEYTKFNYSTGTVTQRNYVQKRIGILAEQKHSYGALLVEVDHNGNWWARQIHIGKDNDIMDVGPRGYDGVHIAKGKVSAKRVVEGIYWADIHAKEMDEWVKKMAWGKGGMLDTLKPKYQFMGDVLSMTTRGHHEMKNFHATFKKHVEAEDSVEWEVKLTSDVVKLACRKWCQTVIVPSNHDDHLVKWLNEADFRADPLNAKYFCMLQYQLLDAMEKGDSKFNIMQWAMRRAGTPRQVKFLDAEASFIVAGAENGLHGDRGPNGARGSTVNLQVLGRPINKGHDHRATVKGDVYSAGACATRFSYARGPQSKSVSHIATYKNGSRAIITMRFNKWRA